MLCECVDAANLARWRDSNLLELLVSFRFFLGMRGHACSGCGTYVDRLLVICRLCPPKNYITLRQEFGEKASAGHTSRKNASFAALPCQ